MTSNKSHLSKKALIDYKLLTQAQKGHQKAFDELVKRYKDAIYYTMLERIGNQADAEELTFEAFLKAFTNLHQYSTKFSFSTWLFKIAENNCKDFFRKRKNEIISLDKLQNTLEITDLLSLNKTVDNSEEKEIIKQRLDKMKREVEKLKDKYKTLIKLRYFREYTYKEIAEELAIPLGTVKTQLFRARKILIKNIKKSAVD